MLDMKIEEGTSGDSQPSQNTFVTLQGWKSSSYSRGVLSFSMQSCSLNPFSGFKCTKSRRNLSQASQDWVRKKIITTLKTFFHLRLIHASNQVKSILHYQFITYRFDWWWRVERWTLLSFIQCISFFVRAVQHSAIHLNIKRFEHD